LRYIDTVLALPLGEWTSTAEVFTHVTKRGHAVSRRTIERGLVRLAGTFAIESREVVKTNGKVWRRLRAIE